MPHINVSIVSELDSRISIQQIEEIVSNIVRSSTGANPRINITEKDSPGVTSPINIYNVLENARPL